MFPDDLEAFKRTRRAPGRPRKLVEESAKDKASAISIVGLVGSDFGRRLLSSRSVPACLRSLTVRAIPGQETSGPLGTSANFSSKM